MIKERRDLLARLGKAGALLAAGPGCARSAMRKAPADRRALHSPIARSRRVRPSSARLIPRASRPRHLHRRLPALAARRRERLSDRRGTRDQGTGRADRALSGRQLRLRLQLAGRRRPEGAAADRAGAGLEFDWRRISSAPTSSSSGAGWSAPSRCSASTSAPARARWRWPTSSTAMWTRHQVERPAARARLRAAAQRAATGAWATRWTARGRWASCRRASTAAKRATPRSRCASSTPTCS